MLYTCDFVDLVFHIQIKLKIKVFSHTESKLDYAKFQNMVDLFDFMSFLMDVTKSKCIHVPKWG